jgi:DNA-binding PadR family transcriptional regulator
MEVSGLPSGTVYPVLRRLEREGVLSSEWEMAPGPGPRRRVYALTQQGEVMARAADERLREARRFLAGELRPGEVGSLGGGKGRT